MRVILLSLLVLSALSSCRFFGGKRVRGNGNVVSQERNVGGFRDVSVNGAIALRLRQGTERRVQVETDQNLLEYLDVYLDGNTLVVEPRKGYNLRPSRSVTVYATAPQFGEIDASGACSVTSEGTLTSNSALTVQGSGAVDLNLTVNVPKLTTSLSGSGEAVLRGEAKIFDGSVSGAGSIRGFDLRTENANIDLSGAGKTEITANKSLEVDVSGSADVLYKGNATVNQRISGAGSVRKVD